MLSQLLHQFPTAFEFNEDLLVFIADSAHACLFGTFLGNSERERKVTLGVEANTQSIWTHVLDPAVVTRFKNPQYVPTEAHLWPSASRVRLWERYYCRWEPSDQPRVSSGIQWKDVWE